MRAWGTASNRVKDRSYRLGRLVYRSRSPGKTLPTKMLVFRMAHPAFYNVFVVSKRIGGYSKPKATENH